MLDRIAAYIKEWHMLNQNDHVIVGISGGADSVCLLFVLHKLREIFSIDITGVHVNHGLRGGKAIRDEEFASRFCRQMGIPCIIYRQDVRAIAKQRRRSEEEAGRDIRREMFVQAMQMQGGTKIALAHHQHDNAETMLMNLARGSGLRGLGGMRPVNKEVIRPLLCVNRIEIEGFLADQKLAFCEDASNRCDLYTRNRVRNHVLPYLEAQVNQRAIQHIAESMERLRQIQGYLDGQADIWYQDCIRFENQDIILLREPYAKVPEALKPMLLQRILEQLAGAGKDIAARHLKAADRLMGLQNGRKISLPYGITAIRCYTGVCFSKKSDAIKVPKSLPLPINGQVCTGGRMIRTTVREAKANLVNSPEKHYTKQFDYDIMKSDVSIRTRKAGDYIVIDQQGSRQKLKAFFINNKVPRRERDQILLIAKGSHILWITGMRQSMAARPDKHTKDIIEIEIIEATEEKNGGDN